MKTVSFPLSSEQALRILVDRPNRVALGQALRWQDRVRFHGLVTRDKGASAYWPDFKRWVFKLITAVDKQNAFETLVTFPLPTNRLAAEVQDSWSRVFDAVNPRFDIESTEDNEIDLRDYLTSIGEESFWVKQSLSALWESHNDLLIVDLPESSQGKAEPYFTRLALDSVIDVKIGEDGVAEHVAYRTADGKAVVLCPGYYRVYKFNDGNPEQLTEIPHDLGYCPARLLWAERVPGHAVAAASPIDEVLYFLDYLVLWWFATDLFKLFGAFPIMWEVESRFADDNTRPRIITDDPGIVGCKPHHKDEIPPGIGFGEVRIVSPTDDPKAPLGIVEPSVPSLDFQKLDRYQMFNELLMYLSGQGGESNLMTKALNEKQVTATFSGKENAGRYISNHLSAAREWLVNTIAKLRLGNNWGKATTHFGTEYYAQSEAELWDKLTKARESGASQTILDEIIGEIQKYRHRLRPSVADRAAILTDCEPFPQLSLSEVIGLLPTGAVDGKTVAMKAQFIELVRQVERYYGVDITQIGVALDYDTRITKIKQFLSDNVRYSQPPAVNSGGNSDKPGGADANQPATTGSGATAETRQNQPEPAES